MGTVLIICCFLHLGYHLNQHLQHVINLAKFSEVGTFDNYVKWLKKDAFPNIFPAEDLAGDKLNAGMRSETAEKCWSVPCPLFFVFVVFVDFFSWFLWASVWLFLLGLLFGLSVLFV